MTKYIFMLGIGVSSLLLGQGLQCKDYLLMSDTESKQYIKEFKSQLKLYHFDTNLSKQNKVYLKGLSTQTKQLKKCILLKKSQRYSVYDDRRYNALLALNRMKLNPTEKHIRKESINASKSSFASFSDTSVIKNISHLPLLYLTAQRDTSTKAMIVYEQRLVKDKVVIYQKVIDPNAVKFFAKRHQNEYISYLEREKNIKITLPKKITPPKEMINTIVITDKKKIDTNKYFVTKLWKVKNIHTENDEMISVNSLISFLKKHKYIDGAIDIYFTFEDKTYIVTTKEWNEYTKKKENQ